MRDLSPWAEAAVAHVERRALGGPVDPALRVTLNFHPDRLHLGMPILRAMARDGRYRNQFETGTSNGGLTAHPGGTGGSGSSASSAVRMTGPPPRSGPSTARSTTASPPSAVRRGSVRRTCGSRRTPSRAPLSVTPTRFSSPNTSARRRTSTSPRRLTDDWATGVPRPRQLRRGARPRRRRPRHAMSRRWSSTRSSVAPRWRRTPRPCRALSSGTAGSGSTSRRSAPPDYRGAHVVDVAVEIAVGDHLDPGVIGAAVATGRHDPQDLKQVWHHLARFGRPT